MPSFPTSPEIRPLDLGNTLARAAQINALRNRNEFSKLQIAEFNKKQGQQEAIDNAFASDDPLNSLLGLGQSGLPAAKQVVDFKTSLANLEGKDLENVIQTGRLVNDALNSALDSANPRQSVGLALKNPVLAKLFPKIDLDSVSDEELISSLENLRSETDLFNDPQEISRLISGQEATDLGFVPGTVLQQKSTGGQVTDTTVKQKPPSKGLSLSVGPDGTVNFSQGNVDAPPVDDKKINTEAVQSANNSAALRRDMLSSLPELAKNRKSVGIRGNVGLGLGGVFTNILGEQAGDAVSQAIAGNDQEKIAQIQTRLTTLRSKLREILTGEGGARQSETERQIASKAIGFIDQIKGPADLARSFPQLQGALKELIGVTLENEFEQASRSPAVEFPVDLTNDQGFRDLWEMLSAAGFTIEEGIRVRDRLLKIRNQ